MVNTSHRKLCIWSLTYAIISVNIWYFKEPPNWPLQWRHNGHDSVSNHQPHDCLFNRLLRRRSKKRSKLRVTGLCAGNSPGTGEFPAQMASNAENASIWWRHHGCCGRVYTTYRKVGCPSVRYLERLISCQILYSLLTYMHFPSCKYP